MEARNFIREVGPLSILENSLCRLEKEEKCTTLSKGVPVLRICVLVRLFLFQLSQLADAGLELSMNTPVLALSVMTIPLKSHLLCN